MKPYLMRSHDMLGEPKTGDRLLEVIDSDIKYIRQTFGVLIIAWCTDNGPDGKKARRLLHERWIWMIVLVCWAHQINLIVGDFLKHNGDIMVIVQQALDIVNWFNGHGEPLEWLRREQILTYGGSFWALFSPVATRWLSHFLTFSRLLKVKSAMKSCYARYEEKLVQAAGPKVHLRTRAQNVLQPIGDPIFWDKLQT